VRVENDRIEIVSFPGPDRSVTIEGLECLSVCPECGSENLQVSILSTWRNDATEQLHKEGRLIYVSMAYDRSGTRPETHICLDCGCQWHNSAAIYQWNKIVSEGRQLTKKDLGLK